MGTLAHEIPEVPRPLAWLWEFLKHELAPYPGRAVTVARMVLAVTLVMIICNTFRIPYAFLGGIYALLISRESPRSTLNSAGTVLLLAAAGVAYILISIQFVISVPLLHFLWTIGSCQCRLKIPQFAPIENSPLSPVEISPGADRL